VAFVLAWFLREVPLRERGGLMQGMDETFGLQDVGRAEICEELEVRRQAAQAALRRLDEVEAGDVPPRLIEGLRRRYRERVDQLEEYGQLLEGEQVEQSPEFRRVVLDLLQTERTEMERLTEHDGVSQVVADRAIRRI